MAGGTSCALCLCVLGDTGIPLGDTGIPLGDTGIPLGVTGVTLTPLLAGNHLSFHLPGAGGEQPHLGRCARKKPTNLISQSFPALHSPAGRGDFPAQPQNGMEGQGWFWPLQGHLRPAPSSSSSPHWGLLIPSTQRLPRLVLGTPGRAESLLLLEEQQKPPTCSSLMKTQNDFKRANGG